MNDKQFRLLIRQGLLQIVSAIEQFDKILPSTASLRREAKDREHKRRLEENAVQTQGDDNSGKTE